jgi:hypothetical protein
MKRYRERRKFVQPLGHPSNGVAKYIAEMPDYEADFPDVIESAYILFDGKGGGEFAFGCVTLHPITLFKTLKIPPGSRSLGTQ